MGKPWTAIVLLAIVWGSITARAAERVALLIGNSKYAGSNPLPNPGNDADAMAQALEGLNFKVLKKKDLDKRGMDDALVEFSNNLTKNSVALFFYAGHGIQVKGENYLIAVNARIRKEFEVADESLSVAKVLSALDERSRLKIMVLDCCRDNPFQRSWQRSLKGQGLAAIAEVPQGTLIAFSTAPGTEADDGNGENSPYTKQLVRVLRSRPRQGLELVSVFRQASRMVKEDTGQTPWLNLEASLPEFKLWTPGGGVSKTTSAGSSEGPAVAEPAAKNIVNSIGMKLVLIPAGEFMMGDGESAEAMVAYFNGRYSANLKAETAHCKGQYPQHRVRVTRPFYLGACHVTRGQFQRFVEEEGYKTDAEKNGKGGWGGGLQNTFAQRPEYTWRSPGFAQTDEHPVVCVSWNAAAAFCRWLSHREGKKYRLPTEAEWEYACRAGTTTRYWCGDDPEGLAQVGNVADSSAKAKFNWDWECRISASDGYVFTSPVGSFRPNPFGLYDMHGNAAQWCADWYGATYYHASPKDDPKGRDSGSNRVFRGGSWRSKPYYAQSAYRSTGKPDYASDSTGFRVARTP
jgi:formylglycine-generating enzyme required for sulfatase activity